MTEDDQGLSPLAFGSAPVAPRPGGSGSTADDAAAHTPGPWQIRDDYTPDGRVTIIANIDGEYVNGRPDCTYDTVAVCEDMFGERLPNAPANARAISALPDVLAALRLCVGCLAGHPDPEHEAHALRAARAAIARVEGRE